MLTAVPKSTEISTLAPIQRAPLVKRDRLLFKNRTRSLPRGSPLSHDEVLFSIFSFSKHAPGAVYVLGVKGSVNNEKAQYIPTLNNTTSTEQYRTFEID